MRHIRGNHHSRSDCRHRATLRSLLVGSALIVVGHVETAQAACTLTIDGAAAKVITASLASGHNVTLTTSATSCSGPGRKDTKGEGDIVVAAPINWTSKAKLTLKAYDNVLVNTKLLGPNLAIAFSWPGGQLVPGTLRTQPGARITMTGTTPTLVINGNKYVIINKLSQLNAINNDQTFRYYALNADLTFGTTAVFRQIGFNAQGNNAQPRPFTTAFDGLGHSIKGLQSYSANCDNAGMFGNITGSVRNLALIGGSAVLDGTHINIGMLAARNSGVIDNVIASGRVAAGAGTMYVGGLVGYNVGMVNLSAATGTVSAESSQTSPSSSVGGLVGASGVVGAVTGGYVLTSHATGLVSAGVNAFSIGGLIGSMVAANVAASYATGTASGGANSYSLGGLVGFANRSNITRSYATGTVVAGDGGATMGGLVGELADGGISDSFAQGQVLGGYNGGGVGGLVGITGGQSTPLVQRSYSRGAVPLNGNPFVAGGLIGADLSGMGSVVRGSYWDIDTSGRNASAGGTGLGDAQMHNRASYQGWDFTTVWLAPTANTYPTLLGMAPP